MKTLHDVLLACFVEISPNFWVIASSQWRGIVLPVPYHEAIAKQSHEALIHLEYFSMPGRWDFFCSGELVEISAGCKAEVKGLHPHC